MNVLVKAILLSLVAGVCSTVLVHPWFLGAIFKKGGLKEKFDYKYQVWMQPVFFAMAFAISMLLFLKGQVSINIYGMAFPITFMLIFQGFQVLWFYEKWKNNTAIIFSLIAFLFLGGFANQVFSITTQVPNYTPEGIAIKSGDFIAKEYGYKMGETPCFSNNRYLYFLKGEDKMALAVIDKSGLSYIDEIRYNPNSVTWDIRKEFPNDKIDFSKLCMDDKNNVYASFKWSKPGPFGKEIGRILLDLNTGEFFPYLNSNLPEYTK